ncbi:MAG: DUF371 domain-containing protein [Candidatus Thorarchaeota archaeon]|nr:MAG: DUF371 domain-containing protein [Candidatus Thorarchaeota archaeon]RLI59686.1 MAG: DUF371 domain-containing protein [Candidatus Thorarchaeota archaeon]
MIWIHKSLERGTGIMERVSFNAYGHTNVIGSHKTTLEITTEDFLTRQGTCIVGVRCDLSLRDIGEQIRHLAKSPDTEIVLRLRVRDMEEEIRGRGSPGLTYSDPVSMVTRTSSYECGRTVMVRADKAARDLDRSFIEMLRDDETVVTCELEYFSE